MEPSQLPSQPSQKSKAKLSPTILMVTIAIVSLLAGGMLGYSIVSKQINSLQNQISTLQGHLANLQSTQNVTYIFLGDNASLSKLYEEVKDGVVIIRGVIMQTTYYFGTTYTEVEGSGLVYNLTGQLVIITNYHVVQNATNITVTFADGDAYATTLLGSDPYADLAVLSANAPQYEYKPLNITSSSTLKVGDPVIAFGNPLGLAGSMTSGIVSALGRSVTVDWSSYAIADCIQTSAPINPGNSGGPLINYKGEVVGITSYGATDPSTGQIAQGIGLAIPSSTILREIKSLVTKGSYNQHPWLGVSGTDMTYEIAKAMNVKVTYGMLITTVTSGGPAASAGLRGGTKQVTIWGNSVTTGGDIIIAINGTRITSTDDLSTYLEEHTLPNQTIIVTIVRNTSTMNVTVVLGTRPAPS
jgi:S1-C subfamily serine protease